MLIERTDLPNSRVKLSISATAHQFAHAFQHELADTAKDITVPGFRPGKAPAQKVIERVGRQRLEAGAIDHAISEVYFQTVQELKLVPVETPKVNVDHYEAWTETDSDDKEVLKFTVEVDVLPEVSIKGYEKIRIKKNDEPVVEADEVEKVIHYLLKQQARLEGTQEGAILENGMWVDIGYEGSVGGVKRDDMKNEHHPLVIGEGSLVPGFEESILGMKVGDKRGITVTFPTDYQSAELAGKEAAFDVELFELKTVELPARDDAFANHFGHDSYDKLKEAIRENLHQEKSQESQQKVEEEVLEELLKIATFDVPQSLIEEELERMYQESRKRLDGMKFQWETYLQQVDKTEETVRNEMRPQAEKNVRIGLALGKVMDAEGIKTKQGSGREAVERLLEIAKQSSK